MNKRMIKTAFLKTFFVIIIISLLMPTGLWARGLNSAITLIILKLDNQVMTGNLLRVKQDSLVLISPSNENFTVHVNDIDTISYRKKRSFWKGIVTGMLIGGGLCTLACLDSDCESPILAFISGALFWGAPLGTVGAFIGKETAGYKKILLKGKSSSEKKTILQKISKKALIRD